jgi:alkylhydroperoxidase family enzyme
MARIDLPDGELPEVARVYALVPELGPAVGALSGAVYERSMLPARVKEAVRMRIALINDCPV